MTSFRHLLASAEKAMRGKRSKPAVLRFEFFREPELFRIQDALRSHTWEPGVFHEFVIRHPKPRLIHAAPFRDRVVHHALVGVLEPIWERTFIHDSYASRNDKGTHAAMRRAQEFARRNAWVWKADVRHFFPNVDHPILKERIARKIKDPDVLKLANLIIDRSPRADVPDGIVESGFYLRHRRCGLPIGNQTSQFFANVYLDALDHFVKEKLHLDYARYVDDFVLFAHDRQTLQHARRRVIDKLAELRLNLHPTKDAMFPVTQGFRFVGYRVFPTHVKLPPENVYRFRRRLRDLSDRYHRSEIEWNEIVPRVMSWWGHASIGPMTATTTTVCVCAALRGFVPSMPESGGRIALAIFPPECADLRSPGG